MEHELGVSLVVENEKLRREVEDLKTLQSVVKENLDLRSRLGNSASNHHHNHHNNTTLMEKSHISPGTRSILHSRDSFVGENSFRADLITPHCTSSPMKNTQSRPARPVMSSSSSLSSSSSSSSSSSQTVKDPERVLGEIAFQVERRILSYVFIHQTRLYGFTVQNIPEKIIQVSTHPLTGQEDEQYRTELTERYVDLMDRLGALGYSRRLHPPFAEFIINTYGILKERPDVQTAQEQSFNSLGVLRSVMVETTPSALLKDMLVLFSCLCYLTEKDGKPLILW